MLLVSLLLVGSASLAPKAARAEEMALGVAADERLTFSTTALTGMMTIDPADRVQAFFAIGDTSPFNINFAGLIKHTLIDHQGIGLHVGGGVGIGAASALANSGKTGNGFAMSVTAIAGAHFMVPGQPHLAIHLDAGPVFQTVDGSTDFHIGALSSALGLSVFYIF